MAAPWTFAGEPPSLGAPGGTVTLVEGSAFCISARTGDIVLGAPQGLFFRDTRFLSRLEVRLDGSALEALAASSAEPFAASFVGRSRPGTGRADSTLLVSRDRYIGRGMREDLVIRNFGEEATYCNIELIVAADFASLFEVKEGRPVAEPDEHLIDVDAGALVFRYRRGATRRGMRLSFSQPATIVADHAAFETVIPPRGDWRLCIQVTPIIELDEIEPRYRCGEPVDRATPAERMEKWRRGVPVVATQHPGLEGVVSRSAEDLGALRIFDPEFPERAVVAAGAPWFMTLFGRDSIITSWMALLVDPDLALGVLQTLARFQGKRVNPRDDEEPGRILHEMRFGEAASLSLGGGHIYYGSADATPLFVMLLGELRRWGLASEIVDTLLPHADEALAWIEEYGDRDGDGYVEYQRATDRGLSNQGWKDSWDAIRFADGELGRSPLAVCEVQGYVYGAYVARYHFAAQAGDEVAAERWRSKATNLKEAFNRDFWIPERGWFAMALDNEKRQVDALASNMGHCLWTGIVDEDKAAAVVKHLMSDEMLSGWGVRTLGESMVGYNPISYHNGSVWPHDNALIAAGLMRYGFVEEAHRVILTMLDAAAAQGHRLPELFAGLGRREFPVPVSYPTSCSPQAWAAASPLLFLRTLLRLDPWVPQGKVWLAPAVPPEIGRLRVERIPLAGGRVSVEVDGDDVHVEGLPSHLELITTARHPLMGEPGRHPPS
jgi:glycogen debranching enzyme